MGSSEFLEDQNPKIVKGSQGQTFLRRTPSIYSVACGKKGVGGVLIYTEGVQRNK